MAPRKRLPGGPVPVDAIRHEDKRLNIPTADSEELLDEEAARPVQLRYERDPSLDPQLVWKGKDEQDDEDLVVEAPADLHPGEDRTAGYRREPAPRSPDRTNWISSPTSMDSPAGRRSSTTSMRPTGRTV